MADRLRPARFKGSEGAARLIRPHRPFHEDLLVRTDAASVEACLKICLLQLRDCGLVIPE